MRLRHQIEALRRAAERAGISAAPPTPLVVICHRVGDHGETRKPGVYYDGGPGSSSPTVVYEGDEPDETVLAQFLPARGPGPLILAFGPEVVEPPLDLPT